MCWREKGEALRPYVVQQGSAVQAHFLDLKGRGGSLLPSVVVANHKLHWMQRAGGGQAEFMDVTWLTPGFRRHLTPEPYKHRYGHPFEAHFAASMPIFHICNRGAEVLNVQFCAVNGGLLPLACRSQLLGATPLDSRFVC